MRKFIMALILALCACTYQAPVAPIGDVSIYTTNAAKIPGKYALAIIAPPNVLDVDVLPSSSAGADATFQMHFSSAFRESVRRVNEQLFASVEDVLVCPSQNEMHNAALDGCIEITANFYEPSVCIATGMVNTSVSASANLGMAYLIKSAEGQGLLTGTISNSRTSAIKGGVLGLTKNDSIKALQDATQKALREDLEQYTEKVSNDAALRVRKR